MNVLLLILSLLAWLAILAGAWLAWQMLRQNGRLLLRIDQLEQRLDELESGAGGAEPEGLLLDTEAPAFDLPDLAGRHQSLAQYRGQPLLLIFFNPDCGYCLELLPRLKEKLQISTKKTGAKEPTLLIISTGAPEANRTLFEQHQLPCPVLLQNETEVGAAYQSTGTPAGYLISPEGKIASTLALGGQALLALFDSKIENGKLPAATEPVASAAGSNGHARADRFRMRSLAHSKIKRDGLQAGTPAPDFRLPLLDGRGELTLTGLRGHRVLLVFSSPNCGPCLALAPHLENFHREHPEIQLVMISKGEPKETRAKVKEFGLTFPIVLQQQWEVSRLYAMFATPVAYLIDEAGTIIHDVAVGTDAILALLANSAPQSNTPPFTLHAPPLPFNCSPASPPRPPAPPSSNYAPQKNQTR